MAVGKVLIIIGAILLSTGIAIYWLLSPSMILCNPTTNASDFMKDCTVNPVYQLGTTGIGTGMVILSAGLFYWARHPSSQPSSLSASKYSKSS